MLQLTRPRGPSWLTQQDRLLPKRACRPRCPTAPVCELASTSGISGATPKEPLASLMPHGFSRATATAQPSTSPPSYEAAVESIDEETESIMEKYIETFKAADTDNDGLLHKAELRGLLERVGCGSEAVPTSWLLDSDIDEIMAQYDVNRDGAISLDEFILLAQDKVFLSKELAEYRAAFAAVDKGGDGFIGPSEMCSILQKLGSPLQKYEEILRIMHKYDQDHNGRIDFGEFLRLCRYEKALPINDILHYAATASTTSVASDSDDGAKLMQHRRALQQSKIVSPLAAQEDTLKRIESEAHLEAICNADPSKLVVIIATLSWCRPCKRILPAFQRLAENYPAATFLRLNGDDSTETKVLFKRKLKIRASPSFIFIRQGQIVGSCTGANPSRIETNLRVHLMESEVPEKNVYELLKGHLE